MKGFIVFALFAFAAVQLVSSAPAGDEKLVTAAVPAAVAAAAAGVAQPAVVAAEVQKSDAPQPTAEVVAAVTAGVEKKDT